MPVPPETPGRAGGSVRWVLLPGMHGSAELFQPLLSIVPMVLKPLVICYPLQEKLSYRQLEEFVVERLPDEPFILVAESFSGPIAIRIAERAPANLRALILCATFVQFPAGMLARLLAATIGPFIFNLRPPGWIARRYLLGNASPELEQLFSSTISDCSAAVMASRLRSIVEVDAREALSRVKTPILILTGTRDRLVKGHNAEKMKRLNEAVVLGSVDAPHLLLQTRPREAFEWIQRFLLHA
ncbi:MAG: alpha/beta hydrolase [Verrucomicrobiales bacterium]|nr:alpha/beta hydrolase [Verrucomicrobiales bacterium]